MHQKERLEEQIRQLTKTIERLNRRVAALEGGAAEAPAEPDGQPTRRRFLRIGAAAAAGAVGLAAGRVLPAAAADNDPILAGNTTLAESSTTLKTDTSSNPPAKVLGVEDKNFSPSALALATAFGLKGTIQGLGPSGDVEGVDGWAEGASAFGVYGLTNAGFGVVGESDTGVSIYARRSGRIQQDPVTDPATAINPAGQFEMVRDQNGAMLISDLSGKWMRPSLNVFPDPRRIVSKAMANGGTYGPFDATKRLNNTASGVPAGAQAAYCAVQSYTPGVLTLFPDGAADPHIWNYSGTGTAGNKLNMLYLLVPLSSAGKFKIHAFFTGTVYVDAWGFLI